VTTLTPIADALETAEDVILEALQDAVYAASPDTPAFWGVADAGTLGRLALATTATDYVPWCLVAQHQDGGGAQANHIGGTGWRGLVVVKAQSRTDANAREGYAEAVLAMLRLGGALGYQVAAVFDRPIAIPTVDKVYTRAGQWRVTIRRTA
jgi:hypothetical protein